MIAHPFSLRAVVATASLLALVVAPASADHDASHDPEVASDWEATEDGGMVSDDVARVARVSKSDNNSVPSLFVSALRVKSNALIAAGIDDWDVATTAFDSDTGAVRWTTAYDAGLGIFDQPVGMEINYNNNIMHVVVDSGGDSSIVTYAVSDGSELRVTPLPGATIRDTTITVSGSEFVAVGEKAGDFHFVDYESGPDAITIDSTPTNGEARAVAIHNKIWIDSQGNSDWAPGDTDSWRTFVATGREGSGASADLYTAAWRRDQVGHDPIWETRWDSADADHDEGLAVETGYVRTTGQTFAWTAGRTKNASGDWDIVVTAHDLNTGALAWTGGTRTWAGPGGTDDEPVAMWFSQETRALYVTGTSDRGAPHGRDIATIAFNALTGEVFATTYSSGDITNGNDHPAAITASHDGQQVFVAAEVLDSGNKHRAAIFAFDDVLNPAGTAFLSEGGFGVDQAAGVATNLDQTHVILGGSFDPDSTNRQDLAGAAFPLEDFEVLPEPRGVAAFAAGFALLLALARRRR